MIPSGAWKISRQGAAVVADNREHAGEPKHMLTPADIGYYGGYLVCESVISTQCLNLIVAAPDMLNVLEWANAWLLLVDGIAKSNDPDALRRIRDFRCTDWLLSEIDKAITVAKNGR